MHRIPVVHAFFIHNHTFSINVMEQISSHVPFGISSLSPRCLAEYAVGYCKVPSYARPSAEIEKASKEDGKVIHI
jgi:hypothetical protein